MDNFALLPNSCLNTLYPFNEISSKLIPSLFFPPQTCRQIGLRGNVHWQCATLTDPLGTAVEVGDCLCDGSQDDCLHDRRWAD